jgi:hypothetical protein
MQGLAELKELDEEKADLLLRRYADGWSVQQVANHLNVAESTFFNMQRQATEGLANAIQRLEEEASRALCSRLISRLEPASYVRLVGVEEPLAELSRLLTKPGPPWIISLQGIGGIGKTSLADSLLRTLINRNVFDEIGWASARQTRLDLGGLLQPVDGATLTAAMLIEKLGQQLLPDLAATEHLTLDKLLASLRLRLKATAHLIVVDNLETVLDVESLLPTLRDLADPTRFVLTTRENLYREPNIYHFAMHELSKEHTLRLIRQEAEWSNLPVLAACRDDELHPIYDTVGGNPLALRLVVGQLHIHPLNMILQDLAQARSGPADNLYTFIYRRAWDHLDKLSQRALLIMLLANPFGEELEYLAEIGDLLLDDLRMAMNQLVTLNLVDARGGIQERRYSIHGLTRTFLREQVAKWIS